MFWPRTKELGLGRKAFQDERIQELLNRLWVTGRVVVVPDEIVYLQDLSPEMHALLNDFLREGRSNDITLAGGKQRVQGVQRDFHSETDWKLAFKMNDRDDNERLAQLFGSKRVYVDVIESLDRDKHEFLIQHKLTGMQYITWIDRPLSAARSKEGR